MSNQCTNCKRNIGLIGNKTLFCKNCGTLLTESLFTDKIEISELALNQIDEANENLLINIGIETDEHNKILAIHYPDLSFILGKILK